MDASVQGDFPMCCPRKCTTVVVGNLPPDPWKELVLSWDWPFPQTRTHLPSCYLLPTLSSHRNPT